VETAEEGWHANLPFIFTANTSPFQKHKHRNYYLLRSSAKKLSEEEKGS
jgi:hypothetical protein